MQGDQQHCHHRAGGRQRQPAQAGEALHRLALPMLRQRGRRVAALLPDDLGELVAHRLELRRAVLQRPVPALKAEHQRRVDQLQQITVGGRVLGQPRHQLEHLLAAPGLVVEHREQAVLRPGPRAAPGRLCSSLVEHRADHVARRHHAFWRDAGGRRLRRKFTHALGELVAQRNRVGDVPGRAKRRHREQQAVREHDQGVQANGGRAGLIVQGLAAVDRRRARARVRLDEGGRLVVRRERVGDTLRFHGVRLRLAIREAPTARCRARGSRPRRARPGCRCARSASTGRRHGRARNSGSRR